MSATHKQGGAVGHDQQHIQSTQLKGHQGAVLCLEHNQGSSNQHHPHFLLSGSEDKTCRLWDLKCQKATTCIVLGDEVVSVAFGRSDSQGQPSSEKDATFSNDFTVYASVGNKVLGFDLRKVSSPIVRLGEEEDTTTKTGIVETVLEAEDEINQVVISENAGQRDPTTYLAACDDTGIVQVVEGIEKAPAARKKASNKRVLHHSQDDTTLLSSCVFRPRSKKKELASAGTDCQVCLWDVSKPKRPMFSKVITGNVNGNQLCNPPMVHSLAFAPSGRLLAAGLGDGTASVFQVESRSLVEVARLQLDTHETPVASILFPSILPTSMSRQDQCAQDRLLACIRNDAIVHFWDLGYTVASEKAINPSLAWPHLGSNKESNVEDAMDGLSLDFGDQPKELFKIPHYRKPNWMTSSRTSEGDIFPSTIFLADVTSDITAYTII